MIESYKYIYGNFYCSRLNLFTPEPHGGEACCQDCVVSLPVSAYQANSWFPSQTNLPITFTLNGEDWLTYKHNE